MAAESCGKLLYAVPRRDTSQHCPESIYPRARKPSYFSSKIESWWSKGAWRKPKALAQIAEIHARGKHFTPIIARLGQDCRRQASLGFSRLASPLPSMRARSTFPHPRPGRGRWLYAVALTCIPALKANATPLSCSFLVRPVWAGGLLACVRRLLWGFLWGSILVAISEDYRNSEPLAQCARRTA